MTLSTLRAEAARACVQLAQQLGALQGAYYDNARIGGEFIHGTATWNHGKVHGALGITANTLSAMAVLLGVDYREAYGLPQGPTGIEVEAARRILAEHRANAQEPECGTISPPAYPGSAPHADPGANRTPGPSAAEWDAQAVAERAEVALMEDSLGAALRVIEDSLPFPSDPGVGYDNARRRADVLLLLLELDAVKAAPDTRRRLEQALEQARYVGD